MSERVAINTAGGSGGTPADRFRVAVLSSSGIRIDGGVTCAV